MDYYHLAQRLRDELLYGKFRKVRRNDAIRAAFWLGCVVESELLLQDKYCPAEESRLRRQGRRQSLGYALESLGKPAYIRWWNKRREEN